MRYLPALLLVAASACMVSLPHSAVAPVASGPAALDCAANRFTALGYTVRERNANAVLAREESGGLVIDMNAEVFTEGGTTRLRVTTSARSGTQELGSVAETREQVNQVLAECGTH
jgi:hypothetical protein